MIVWRKKSWNPEWMSVLCLSVCLYLYVRKPVIWVDMHVDLFIEMLPAVLLTSVGTSYPCWPEHHSWWESILQTPASLPSKQTATAHSQGNSTSRECISYQSEKVYNNGYINIHHSPFIGPIKSNRKFWKITPLGSWRSWNEMYLFPS